MSKPIKCPSCNVNMYISSSPVFGEDNVYSAKVVCPSCDSRFCPVLGHNEASARRLTAKKTREWIAKLKTCESAGHCALQSFEQYEAIKLLPTPPPAPRSIPVMPQNVYIYAAPNGSLTDIVYDGRGTRGFIQYEPATKTVTITPEQLVRGTTAVSVTDLNSISVTPVYSAPGKD